MLERDHEVEVLGRAVGLAARGVGQLLTIEGSPGIGKSRLLAEAAAIARANAGMRVLRARAVPHESPLAYGVVRQLFEPALRDERPAGVLLRGRATEAAPVLGAASGEEPAAGERTVRIVNGLYWLAVNLAERGPVLITVDDAHWADVPSLRYLSYLSRRLEALPVLLVVAHRWRAGLADRARIESLLGSLEGRTLSPAALSPEATSSLVRITIGERATPAFCDACHRASGGNPLLLRELVRTFAAQGVDPTAHRVEALAEVGPAAVLGTVRARLAELPAAATRLAEAAAVLGDRVPVRHAAELAELEPREADSAIGELRRVEILGPGPEVAFIHPLVRDALREGIEPLAAERAHAHAAAALERAGAPDEAVARQLLHIAPAGVERWVEPLRRAAAASTAAGDSAAAASYLRRALAEPPSAAQRPDVLLELASAEEQFDGEASIARLTEALELIDDPVKRAGVAARLASMLPSQRPEEALRRGLEAIEQLGDAAPELRRRLLGIVGTATAMRSPVRGLRAEHLTTMRAAARQPGEGARLLAAVLAYGDVWSTVPLAECVPRAERAFEGDWLPALDVTGGPLVLGLIALVVADSPVAARAIAEWDRRARQRGEFQLFSGARLLRCHLCLAHGELDEAAREGEEALEAMEAWGMRGVAIAFAVSGLAEAALEQGDLERAAEAMARWRGSDEEAGAVGIHGLLATRARVRAAGGELRLALHETLQLGRRFEDLGGRSPALLPWRSRAALLLHALEEDVPQARRLAGEEVELARAWGGPRTLGRALRAAGVVADPSGRRALLEEAVGVLEQVPAPLEQARAHAVLGEEIQRAGSPAEARQPLRQALELAVRCGATALERRIRDRLVDAGARLRRVAVTGPKALTAGERRVAHLAASGRTNREIAEQLYLTPSTVEAHLSRAYRKLGIGSRSRLGEVLGSAGATATDARTV